MISETFFPTEPSQHPERHHSSTPINSHINLPFNSYISALIQITIESLNRIYLISDSNYQQQHLTPLLDPLLQEEVINLMKKSRISYSAHLTSLLYLRRFYESLSRRPTKQRFTNYQSLSCLFVSSMILASKYLLDSQIKNSDWSIISGFSLKDLNRMEINFLNVIRYDVMVTDVSLEKWITYLSSTPSSKEKIVQKKQSNQEKFPWSN